MSLPLHKRLIRGAYQLLPRKAQLASREILGPWPLTDYPSSDKGGDLSRLLIDWVASTTSPNWEVLGSIRRLRARSRDLERNNSYAASYLNLLAANVIGPTGFNFDAQVRNNSNELAKDVNDQLEESWDRWCECVTLDGRHSLVDLLELVIKTVARDGELFVRMWQGPDFPMGFALEPIDCDLVDEQITRQRSDNHPEVRMGIEVDRYGRPTGYHVSQSYAEAGSGAQDYAFIGQGGSQTMVLPASDVIHLARFRRVNQSRGVTWFGPAMIALKMLDGYEEAELVAARTAAAKMGFFTAKGAEAGQFGPDDPSQAMVMEANPGTMEQLPKGWAFEQWDPQHPTQAFPAFVKNVLRKVAAGLGCSYNALASDLEGVNYSSMRSGLLIERDTWRRLQHWMIGSFLKPVYRRWLVQAALSGEIQTGGRPISKLYAAKFSPRGWAWIDPLKDVQAAILGIRSGLDWPQDVLADEGRNVEETLEQLSEFYELAKKYDVDVLGPGSPKAVVPQAEAGDGLQTDDANAGDTTAGTKSVTAPTRRAAVAAALANGGTRNGTH